MPITADQYLEAAMRAEQGDYALFDLFAQMEHSYSNDARSKRHSASPAKNDNRAVKKNLEVLVP